MTSIKQDAVIVAAHLHNDIPFRCTVCGQAMHQITFRRDGVRTKYTYIDNIYKKIYDKKTHIPDEPWAGHENTRCVLREVDNPLMFLFFSDFWRNKMKLKTKYLIRDILVTSLLFLGFGINHYRQNGMMINSYALSALAGAVFYGLVKTDKHIKDTRFEVGNTNFAEIGLQIEKVEKEPRLEIDDDDLLDWMKSMKEEMSEELDEEEAKEEEAKQRENWQ